MLAMAIALLTFPLALFAQTDSAQKISVAELEQFLLAAKSTDDADVARHLAVMELTERVSLVERTTLEAKCGGKECRNALMVLADQSQFLDPSEEDPAGDAPQLAEQKEIVSRLVAFVGQMGHQMPNLIAMRTTARFDDWPKGLQIGQEVPARSLPLRFQSRSRATITYRNGKEDAAKEVLADGKKKDWHNQGLSTWGLFGSMLTTVIVDASRSTMTWSRWGESGGQRLAVFRFAVPMEKSTYQVQFCCVPAAGGRAATMLDRVSAYHGELAVRPNDGSIVYITQIADLEKGDLSTLLSEALEGNPLSLANMAVEYGPVEIGGKPYVCPVHAVAMSRGRTLLTSKGEMRFGPVRTYLNDMTFTGYHVFRSESRMLTDWKEQ